MQPVGAVLAGEGAAVLIDWVCTYDAMDLRLMFGYAIEVVAVTVTVSRAPYISCMYNTAKLSRAV